MKIVLIFGALLGGIVLVALLGEACVLMAHVLQWMMDGLTWALFYYDGSFIAAFIRATAVGFFVIALLVVAFTMAEGGARQQRAIRDRREL